MKNKAWTTVAVVGTGVFIIWLIWNRETTEWTNDVPQRFQGNWRLVKEYGSDNFGVRSIHLSRNVIVLAFVIDDNETANDNYPIRRVSITSRRESQAGEMVIFYGPTSKDTITEKRLQIYYGPKQEIHVQEIVPTGLGEDHWFDSATSLKSIKTARQLRSEFEV